MQIVLRHRESLGLDVVTSEDGAAWLAFLRSLVARGLVGIKLVTSDAHLGLLDAIAATLPGASWQRCRTRFMRNLGRHHGPGGGAAGRFQNGFHSLARCTIRKAAGNEKAPIYGGFLLWSVPGSNR